MMVMSFVYKGKVYKNLKAATTTHGLNYGTVWYRLKSGKSKAEAFADNKREFRYKGKSYPSLRAAAEASGLNYGVVWSRLKSGKSIEEAFSQKQLRRPGQSKPIKIKGKIYPSISIAAHAFGVTENTTRHRLKRGLTPEQAVGLDPLPPGQSKTVNVYGKTFPSLVAAAKYFDVPIYSVHNRLKRGKTLEEAFFKGDLKRKSSKFKTISVSGKNFDSLKDACVHFGISYGKAQYRLRKKWSLNQVFELESPPINSAKNAPKTVKFSEKIYNSYTDLAKEYGINPGNLRQRIAKGWSLEQALELVEYKYKTKPKKIHIDGKVFASRNEAARYYGLKTGLVAERINRRGWSIEQALELSPPPAGFHAGFGCVYLITNNLNSMQYVGITLQKPPNKRFKDHVRLSKEKKNNPSGSLAEAIKQFGAANFSFEVIKYVDTQTELQTSEKNFIKVYNTIAPNGYNLSKGGNIGKVPGRAVEIPSLKLKFKTVAEAARHFEIDPSALLYRMDKGYSPEQCVGLEPLNWRSSKSVTVEIDGLVFPTIKDAARHFGLPPDVVSKRLYGGWSMEKALKTLYKPQNTSITIDGVKYSSKTAAAKALGLSRDRLYTLLEK